MNEAQIFSVILLTFEINKLKKKKNRRRKIEFQIRIWSERYESQISMHLSVIRYDFVFGVLLI